MNRNGTFRVICHRGPSHETGHYFAILIYRDLMWIADDGQTPTHLPHVTPKLASQIAQVFGDVDTFRSPQQVIRDLPPPEEPDYTFPGNSIADRPLEVWSPRLPQ